MKKVNVLSIMALLITILITVSCTSRKKDADAGPMQGQDTLGLAEYQKWKMEAEIRERIAAENELKEEEKAATVAAAAGSRKKVSSSRSSSSRSHTTYTSSGSNRGSAGSGNASVPAQQAPQRKGMSHTAKGAIVGAASGAVIGAIANKNNRVGGGVVGGVIGAATGAGVGAIVDKKEKQKRGY
ncbi:YMGG-like glycine zipper-containing protein [Niabella aquatica]